MNQSVYKLQSRFEISMARFRFTMRADEDARLPVYLGSTLRGAMGKAFRKGACMTRARTCENCMFVGQCAYAYIFETTSEQVRAEIKNIIPLYIPHPFVLEPPVTRKTSYTKGDSLQFNVVLIGTGIQFLPFFIAAFGQAGIDGLGAGRFKYHLESVEQLIEGKNILLWEGGNTLVARPNEQLLTDNPDDQSVNTIIMDLQTPLRLRDGGSLSADLSFTLLMRSIFRRLDLLGKIHGSGALHIPYRDYLLQADDIKIQAERTDLRWIEWERYSNRQKSSLKMGGLCGRVCYTGDLTIFMPYLLMAQELHAGKGTAFGLGKIAITETYCN
jgi:hypothetical protein